MKKQNNKSFARADRIESKVQNLVAEILREREIPVTLVGAESHGGLQFVRLYYHTGSIIAPHVGGVASPPRREGGGAEGGGQVLPAIQKRLDAEKNAIRFELASRMDQKYVPDLRFIYDDTLEKSERIDELLANVKM